MRTIERGTEDDVSKIERDETKFADKRKEIIQKNKESFESKEISQFAGKVDELMKNESQKDIILDDDGVNTIKLIRTGNRGNFGEGLLYEVTDKKTGEVKEQKFLKAVESLESGYSEAQKATYEISKKFIEDHKDSFSEDDFNLIKEIESLKSEGPDMQSRKFLKSMELMSELRNIVENSNIEGKPDYPFPAQYELFESPEGYVCSVQEFIDGKKLNELLESDEGSGQVKECFKDISKRLGTLHKQGYVNRDMNIDNFLVKDNKVSIVDIGFVSTIKDAMKNPENHEEKIDHTLDDWSEFFSSFLEGSNLLAEESDFIANTSLSYQRKEAAEKIREKVKSQYDLNEKQINLILLLCSDGKALSESMNKIFKNLGRVEDKIEEFENYLEEVFLGNDDKRYEKYDEDVENALDEWTRTEYRGDSKVLVASDKPLKPFKLKMFRDLDKK